MGIETSEKWKPGEVAMAAMKEAMKEECKARKAINWKPAEAVRYNGRSIAEHSNGRLKDEFGGRTLRVKGHAKAFCHLMFGVLILSADQLMRLFWQAQEVIIFFNDIWPEVALGQWKREVDT